MFFLVFLLSLFVALSSSCSHSARSCSLFPSSVCSSVRLHFFMDFSCPFSRSSFSSLFSQSKHFLPLVCIHFFPLPYHQNSFLISQAAHFILQHNFSSPRTRLSAVSSLFSLSSALSQSIHLTQFQVQIQVAKHLIKVLPTSENSFPFVFNSLAQSSPYYALSVQQWKAGASAGISGTPTFLFDDKQIPAEDWNFKRWKSFFREQNKRNVKICCLLFASFTMGIAYIVCSWRRDGTKKRQVEKVVQESILV